MYTYRYDETTGGIVLLDDDTVMHSNEPRPVYAREMDFIGMDRHWTYDRQMEIPYLWAEAGTYWYRGTIIAKVKGGALYEAPVLEPFCKVEEAREVQAVPDGTELLPVDLPGMIEQNRMRLSLLEQMTAKRIYNYYKAQLKKELRLFHVAFSGGKDSLVLLDLVRRSLPKTDYMVVFGDTGMEFPDTYEVVDAVERQCREEGIAFYRAKSQFDPMDSWQIFGPPSRVLRWCCSVHKAAPQTLEIRRRRGEENEKHRYIGTDFVGVRKYESLNRAGYDFENVGKKQRGQHSQNPILEWSSAEIWLYIYTHHLMVNEAYKKGNSRAGCLFCPMGGGKGDYFQHRSYPQEVDRFIELIKRTNARDRDDPQALQTYITNGGWNARKNGRDLVAREQHYFEETKDGRIHITVRNPGTDWREWIKTMEYAHIHYEYTPLEDGYQITVSESEFREYPANKTKFKQVFKKAACCVQCRVCEANCPLGCISFEENLRIDSCQSCGRCHEIPDGCLVYHSTRLPMGGTRKVNSVNSFANHAPKAGWVKDYLAKGGAFWTDNSLGPNQVGMFKRFLRDSGLMEDNAVTALFGLMNRLGGEHPAGWGLLLANLAYNPQCMWYINHMEIGRTYTREQIAEMLMEEGVSKNDATSIINAFKRFCDLPLGTALQFGSTAMTGRQISTLTRTKALVEDGRVVLYALFKFAEACGDYYQFTLERLLNHRVESAGVSPTKIFGLNREEMERFLNGLTARYSEFINATFTHDLDKISLAEDKTAEDVLKLFEE